MKKMLSTLAVMALLLPMSGFSTTVIGNWETDLDGWFDWSGAATSMAGGQTVGVTLGSGSLLVDQSGWGQSLSIALDGPQKAAFMNGSILSIDVSVAANPGDITSGWSQVFAVAMNGNGPGFTTVASGNPVNFFWGGGEVERTQTLEIDYSAFRDALLDTSYIEIIFALNTGGGAPSEMYFDNAQLVPEGGDPWAQLESFDFESDAAGLSFNEFTNSGSLNSSWDFGADTNIVTDGAGNLVVSNQAGQFFRSLPAAGTANADPTLTQYATPFTSGVYRVEMDFDSWDLPGNGALQFGVLSGSDIVAAVQLRVNPSNPAETWVQLVGEESGIVEFNTYGAGATNKTTATSAAIEFDFDNDTIEYFVDGASKKSVTNFVAAGFDSVRFSTDTDWVSNNVVTIDAMGITKYAPAAVPVLAVDFGSSQVTNSVYYDHFDYALDLGAPELTSTNTSGQPIYSGLELDPVNGLTTGDPDGVGGTYTNGAGLTFSQFGSGAAVQWNGPFSNPPVPGADLGRYEEDDVATGLFLFKKEDFLNGLSTSTNTVVMNSSNDTLSATIRLDTKENDGVDPLKRLKSGQFRWVVQDAGSFYISAEVTNLTSDTAVDLTDGAVDVSWLSYDPVTSIADVSGAAASPTLQDIDAIGFWMSATVLTNNGIRRYPNIQCTSFQAEAATGVFVPVSGPYDIVNIQMMSGNTQVQLLLSGLTVGLDYKIQDSVDLTAGFSDVAGSQFTATGDPEQAVVVPADTATQPERFFKATTAP